MADAERSQDFYDGSETSRHPAFRPVRVEPYRRTSTLDNLFPTGNGMGEQDKQRALMGIGRSAIGQSGETFDKSLWIRNQPSPADSLYSKTYG
jgi:hypothetical protein